MPCYNCADHAARGINSVLQQTHTDLELIIIDDGSLDQSEDIIRSFDDSRIRLFIQQINNGVSHARNIGIKHSNGQYIAFLDSDDTWEPLFLEIMLDALSNNPEYSLAYCGWQNLRVEGSHGEPFIPPDYETPEKQDILLGGNRWPIHAALTRREHILYANGFDERLTIGEDYLLWLEIACFEKIVRIPQVLAYYHHHHGVQATKDKYHNVKSWQVKRTFLLKHPEIEKIIGIKQIRNNTHGKLLEQAYQHYWKRDLDIARHLFRVVMRYGYGSIKDWKYMLPSILPLSWHKKLISLLESVET